MSLPTQQQPALDTPAVEQHPLVERVVETTRSVGTEKSNVVFATLASYICSMASGALIAYIFDRAFGFPRTLEEARGLHGGEWKVGVGAAITTAFLLGLLFPLLFARSKRPLAVLLTVIMQFITLVVLILVGLSQLPA